MACGGRCRPMDDGGTVCITITDTGIGMTEEVRNRVFEPFFTTKPDGLGSGLGLSMVKGFVEQTGGHIEIDSTVGRGTTITIQLPTIAAVGEVDDTQALADWSANGKDNRSAGGGRSRCEDRDRAPIEEVGLQGSCSGEWQ